MAGEDSDWPSETERALAMASTIRCRNGSRGWLSISSQSVSVSYHGRRTGRPPSRSPVAPEGHSGAGDWSGREDFIISHRMHRVSPEQHTGGRCAAGSGKRGGPEPDRRWGAASWSCSRLLTASCCCRALRPSIAASSPTTSSSGPPPPLTRYNLVLCVVQNLA
uniref:Uncharacterized protein n=1 Tax=Setaria viridis TaxID=4556 RepID=A0A4U6TRI8_SETVI|nr:hypothetical protein SEVIR_7G173150v2 [Setaria viridis]